jgi:hypothetical protein
MHDTPFSGDGKHRLAVAALTIGTENADAVIGRPWRWCVDTAVALGVPVITVRRRPVIPAQAFLDALMVAGTSLPPAAAAPSEPTPTPDPQDAAEVLQALGLRRARP